MTDVFTFKDLKKSTWKVVKKLYDTLNLFEVMFPDEPSKTTSNKDIEVGVELYSELTDPDSKSARFHVNEGTGVNTHRILLVTKENLADFMKFLEPL